MRNVKKNIKIRGRKKHNLKLLPDNIPGTNDNSSQIIVEKETLNDNEETEFVL